MDKAWIVHETGFLKIAVKGRLAKQTISLVKIVYSLIIPAPQKSTLGDKFLKFPYKTKCPSPDRSGILLWRCSP